MEVNWIIIAIFFVCISALIIYLIIRNKKDKDEVVKFLNETEIEEEPQPKEEKDN